jgi:uncharacterized Fe-S cluster-containing radical SAM superfamily enzyme
MTPNEIHSLCEAVADLSANFIVAPVLPGNSRDMTELCIMWAREFEQQNAGREWDGEYIEEIDAFFEKKYAEWREAARETVSNQAIEDKQLARALRDLKHNVETDLHGFWSESTANMVQQADEAIRASRHRYKASRA